MARQKVTEPLLKNVEPPREQQVKKSTSRKRSCQDLFCQAVALTVIGFAHTMPQKEVFIPWIEYAFAPEPLYQVSRGRFQQTMNAPSTETPWLNIVTAKWLILGTYNILLFMIYWNYALASLSDAGSIPKDWKPTTTLHRVESKRRDGGTRICTKCQVLKPPRAHHCSICKRCVLRMDHHCPWIGNCVGHGNHGHFIRFLIYVIIGCSYCLVLTTLRLLSIHRRMTLNDWRAPLPTLLEMVIIAVTFTAVGITLISVTILTWFQLSSMFHNKTTIETFVIEDLDKLVSKKKLPGVRYKFPYDVGCWENVKSILGRDARWWFWPQSCPGDGISFDVIGPYKDGSLYWPPVETRPKLMASDAAGYQSIGHGYDPQRVFHDSEGFVIKTGPPAGFVMEDGSVPFEETRPFVRDDQDNVSLSDGSDDMTLAQIQEQKRR